MKAVTIQGSTPAVYSTTYSQFKGVDFSTDPMLVDKSRSPFAVNLVSDSGGMPEKRPGWRVLHTFDGKINGIWHCYINDADHYLCHAGDKIYKWTDNYEDKTVLREGVNDARSTAFFLLSKLYILTGKEYLQYDGETIAPVEPYVPTVVINRKPDGGGGDLLEPPNLIGTKWTEEFIGDGTTKKYQLSYKKLIDGSTVECKIYDTKAKEWVEKVQGTDFSVDYANGVITFTGDAPDEATIPNVKITASREAKNATKITHAKIAAVYNDSTVFLCGSERGIDYRSGYEKPNYFPDDGYDRVGTDSTDIMGYCKIGEYLGIIKESNSQDSTIFLRWHEQETDNSGNVKTVYRKKQGVVGVGAVSRYCIGSLVDEPLFLSERGVFALTSNAVTFERTVQNRSEYLDFKLTRETGMEEAVCCEWNGYFVVCVNNHAYILDSKQATAKSRNNSNFVYEGYYWENIPARTLLSIGGSLYFGTADGRLCKFNTDKVGMDKYRDGDRYEEQDEDGDGIFEKTLVKGDAVKAVWSTMMDDDGHPQRLKTMVKKGCAVTIKPFARSGAKISIKTEKDPDLRFLREGTMDIFSWEDINFERFTFNTNESPQDIMIKKKIKKYKRMMFYIVNDSVDEGFGVFQITKSYMVLGLAKK